MNNHHDEESELGNHPPRLSGQPEQPGPREHPRLDHKAFPVLALEPDEAIRQSEARFRKFYDNAPVMMHSIDKNRIIRNVNSKWLAEMGFRRDEVIGREVTAFMTPESGVVMASMLPSFWRDGQVTGVNFRYVKRDGTVIDVVLDSVVIDDPLWGESSLSIVRDVTEHRRAEESLRKSEEKFRLLFDHAPIGIVSVDTEGQILEVNRALVEMLGSPSMEATREINILTFPLLVESGLSSTFQLCMAEGRIVTIELPYTSKWGKDCYLRFIMTPMTDAQGQVSGCQAVVEDITERKHTEDSLRESEERYRLLTQHSLSGIYIHQKGTLVYVNDRLAKMLGYAPHEVKTRRFWDFVHPEDRADLRGTGVQLTLGADAIAQYEFRVICKDGRIKWLQVHSTEITYRGQPASMGNVTDITERKQAEADLDKAQALLLAAIEQTPAGILIADAPDVRVRLANPAALGIIGKSTKPLEDIPFDVHPRHWQTFHPDGTPFDEDELPLNRAILRGETSKNVEAIIRQPQGEDRWVLANAAPVRNAAGQVVAGVVVFPDITERKRAEKALSDSQERFRSLYEESKRREELYRSLLDSSPDAVVIYDMDGRAQYVNDAFTRIFGWTIEDVQDKRIPFVPDSELDATMAAIRSVIQEGLPCVDFETKRFTKGGLLRDTSASASRYHDHEGNPAGMLVVLSDITSRKRLEEQLRQAAKMEAIGRLAGGVAHDFNNILTAIMGYSNLLLQEIPQEHVHHERVLQISRAAERAAALTRQLLAFGRKQMLDVRVLDLNAVLADFEKILKRLIGEDIELTTVMDPCLGSVHADPSQIEQILMNLAVNARDAMPHGGHLAMGTDNAYLDTEYTRTHPEVSPGPYVLLTVSDTGCGMDKETVCRIFDPFFTTKEIGVGTGLGLSTVYGIAKQHQGHIEVYSEPGRGTTFKVYLPRVHEPVETDVKVPALREERCGTETVLVVEDDEIVRGLACEVLEMLGYEVFRASDPLEALDLCNQRSEPIDLLLTDVVLPHMDGRSLYYRVALVHPETKVLYVSGYTEDFVVRHGVLDREVHFLQKPFTLNGLACKVRGVLEGK